MPRSRTGGWLVRPLRREVETFRFCTVRLDCRENSTRTTQALQALWQASGGAGEPPLPTRPPGATGCSPSCPSRAPAVRELPGLPPEAAETLGIFRLIRGDASAS